MRKAPARLHEEKVPNRVSSTTRMADDKSPNQLTQPSYRPVTRQLVPDAIVSQLQEMIAKNSLRAGDRVASERELAVELKVSRSAVREAVKIMVSLGILEVRQGSPMHPRAAPRRPVDAPANGRLRSSCRFRAKSRP